MIFKNKLFQIAAGLLMLALVLSCILPLIMLLASSFSSEEQLLTKGYSFFPQGLCMDAYAYLWKIKASLLRAYMMSGIITGVGTIVNVIITLLFAYALSQKDLPGNRVLSFFLFFWVLLIVF